MKPKLANLNENQVVAAVARHLEQHGWTIVQELTTREQGVDIIAANGAQTLEVEAKGSTSSKPTSANFGAAKGMRGDIKVHVPEAYFKAVRGLTENPGSLQAVAFPNDEMHHKYADMVPSFHAWGIATVWVDEDSTVTINVPQSWEDSLFLNTSSNEAERTRQGPSLTTSIQSANS